MNTFDKNLSDLLEVDPTNNSHDIASRFSDEPEIKKITTTAINVLNEPNLKQDLNDAYETSKVNLIDFIDKGKDAMEELLQIAKVGQHPRAFEVFATLLKNMTDANDKLLDMQKKMRDMDVKKSSTGGDTKIDKAIFVGSTSELSKLLKNKE